MKETEMKEMTLAETQDVRGGFWWLVAGVAAAAAIGLGAAMAS